MCVSHYNSKHSNIDILPTLLSVSEVTIATAAATDLLIFTKICVMLVIATVVNMLGCLQSEKHRHLVLGKGNKHLVIDVYEIGHIHC